MKKTALMMALTAASTFAITTLDVGNYISQFNQGSCAAFLDDPTATDSDCYTACEATGNYIESAFDTSSYDSFSPSDVTNRLSVVGIKLMTQMNICQQV
jgi:hypothetical protein